MHAYRIHTFSPRFHHLLFPLPLVLAALVSACTGGGSGPGGLPTEAMVTGTLVDGGGRPFSDARVTIDARPPITGLPAEDGAFSLMAPPGNYALTVSIGPAVARVEEVRVPPRGELDLGELQVLSTVFGQVVDGSGSPLPDVLMQVKGPLPAQAASGANGVFELQLPTGSYVLVASWQGNELPPRAFDVQLPAPLSLGIFQGLVALKGVLVDGVSRPLAGAAVWVESTPSVVSYTDEGGAFVAQVPSGAHPVRIELDGMILQRQEVSVAGPGPVDLGALQVLARINGCVVDDLLQPVPGVEIEIDTAPKTSTTTGPDGTFRLDLPFDTLQLSVHLNGLVVQQTLLAPQEGMPGVIAILPGMGVIQLPDILVDPQGDSDGDGLGDALEVQGWTILVDELGDGTSAPRHVHAHPGVLDADGDGLLDNEEFLVRTDPRSEDTDLDFLLDREELVRFKSDPRRVDTDGDARDVDASGAHVGLPNPSLFDGYEFYLSRTSPTLADTDGDGIGDHTEILEGGTNPLVANLPSIEIDVVGEPLVELNKTIGTTTTTHGSTLQKAANTVSRSFSFNLKTALQYSAELKAEFKLIPKKPYFKPAKAEAKLNASIAINTDTTFQASQSSSNELQREVRTGLDQVESFDSGTVEAVVQVRNDSNVAVRFTDLEVVAFRVAPTSGTSAFQPLGILRDAEMFGAGDSLDLGPQEAALLSVSNRELNASAILDYVSQPTGLNLQIGNFSLKQLDAFGHEAIDYDLINQDIVERTALLTIDRGEGHVERYAVATNVERNPDGSAAGITLGEVLGDVLGEAFQMELDVEPIADGDTGPYTFGKRVLVSIGSLGPVIEDFEVPDENGELQEEPRLTHFWMLLGPGVVDDITNYAFDFDQIRLMPGESYSLTYVVDEDNDGLILNEESFYGSSDHFADTDADGLDDWAEVKEGWPVLFQDCDNDLSCTFTPAELESLTFTVHSHPRFRDFDGDGLADSLERDAATDPTDFDTDGDAQPDGLDSCNGPECGSIPTQLLASALACDDGTLIVSAETLFQDISGANNHGLIGGPIARTVSFSDPSTSLQKGYFLTGDRHGSGGSALWVWNDDLDTIYVPCGLFGLDTCPQDVSDGRAAVKGQMRIERTGPAAPALAAEAPDGADAGWTWSVWVAPKETGTAYPNRYSYTIKPYQVVLSQPGFAELQILRGGAPLAKVVAGSTTLLTAGAAADVPQSRWTHLALTVRHDNPLGDDEGTTEVTLYVNGVQVGTPASIAGPLPNPSPRGQPNALPIWIGWPVFDSSETPFDKSLNGGIDDLKAYGKALAPEEVMELYTSEKP